MTKKELLERLETYSDNEEIIIYDDVNNIEFNIVDVYDESSERGVIIEIIQCNTTIVKNIDDFIKEIESAYKDAEKRGFDSIVITIDTDLDNTYYINDTKEGYQCDVFDYVFDDLYSIARELYDELHGNVTEIRIE